jgi:tripartite-type tricarboxylate transporter receptor subunit TctC
VQSVIAGDTQVTFATPPSAAAADPRAAGWWAGRETTTGFPAGAELPGMKEAGLPGYKIDFWYGFFVPAGTPPEISQEAVRPPPDLALQASRGEAALAREAPTVSRVRDSPAEFARVREGRNRFWAKLAKDRARRRSEPSARGQSVV